MSCLFNSVGSLIGRDPQMVRQEVADFLSNNKQLNLNDMVLEDWIKFSQENTESVDDYIRSMRSSSVWGGCLEMICMTLMYNIRIHVQLQGTDTEIVVGNAANSPVRVLYNGAHYTPMH